MNDALGELSDLERTILGVPRVRGVSALLALDRGDDGLVVVARVGLSPTLRLADVVLAIAEIEHRVKVADPRVRAVFVEPDIAADAATPTETIVIRALD